MTDLQREKLGKWLDKEIFNEGAVMWFASKLREVAKYLDPNKTQEHFGVGPESLTIDILKKAILDEFYKEAEQGEMEYRDRLSFAITSARELTELCLKDTKDESYETIAELFKPFWSVQLEGLKRELDETSREGEVIPFSRK